MGIVLDDLAHGNQHGDLRLCDPILANPFRIINRMSAARRDAAADLLHMFIISRENRTRESQR